MTIREAFEKAGHPVPGEQIYFSDTNGPSWHAVEKTGRMGGCFAPYMFNGAWIDRGIRYDLHPRSRSIDLSNLPARDAYDALPECVQKVLDEVTP